MERARLDAERITRPIQLAAAWFVTLVLVEGGLLATATQLDRPYWARGLLIVAAVVMPVGAGFAVYFLQTRYRPELLADPYYSEVIRKKEERFRDFHPIEPSVLPAPAPKPPPASEDQARRRRDEIYQHHRGLFLIHSWRPSTTARQVADIVIQLYQHGDGPLTDGTVEVVEYDLGPKFSPEPLVVTDPDENFRLDVSAYGSMLCVATVHFNDGTSPLVLDRYIDFN